MTKNFDKLERMIGVEFKNKPLLLQAFTHRSYINEHKGDGIEHNERLEYLGDAVLEMVVTDYLFNNFKDKDEGELTSARSAIVNTQNLSRVALALNLNDFLLLSKGEAKDIGRARLIILADTTESLIGAIYQDQGYGPAKDFITKYILDTSDVKKIFKHKLWLDAKSRFQERAQEETGNTPMYKLLKDTGPDHEKTFTIGVYLGTELIGTGSGPSKQEAEQAAAEDALEEKGW
jgi:ribonuclease-3